MKLLNQIELKDIFNDLINQIESISEDKLIQIVLFGSYANSKASAESDIDLLVILESDDVHIVESIRDASYNLMWHNDFDFIISLHFITKDHYNLIKKINTSFYQEINKSESALQAAESLQKQRLLSDSISRAYYAMFYGKSQMT